MSKGILYAIDKSIRDKQRRQLQAQRAYQRALKEQARAEKDRLMTQLTDYADTYKQNIDATIDEIENMVSNTYLFKYNYEGYYKRNLKEFKISPFIAGDYPNIEAIKKRIGYKNKNVIAEKFSSKRKQAREEKEIELNKIWEDEINKYNEIELKRKKAYNQLVIETKQEIEKHNKEMVYDKIEKFKECNLEEVIGVINHFMSNNLPEPCYLKKMNIWYDDAKKMEFNLEFIDPLEELPKIKSYRVLKNGDTREIYFTNGEIEQLFEKIVFNTILTISAKILYSFSNQVDELIFNGFINKINKSNGEYEDFYFITSKIKNDDIPFDKLKLIDSKSFLDTKDTKYLLPLINAKRINAYHIDEERERDIINDEYDGIEFEKISKQLLEANGFEDVEVTKSSGDYGADVIASKDGVKYAIQCKKYSSKVGVDAVKEVLAAKSMYKCHVGVVLTNNYFTPNAIKLAEANGILLWDIDKLNELIGNKTDLNNDSGIIKNHDSVSDLYEEDYEDDLDEGYEDEEFDDIDDNYEVEQINNTKKHKKELYNDDELEAYGLEDWQKEEVKNDNYDPWNFEEEEFDEDDYNKIEEE